MYTLWLSWFTLFCKIQSQDYTFAQLGLNICPWDTTKVEQTQCALVINQLVSSSPRSSASLTITSSNQVPPGCSVQTTGAKTPHWGTNPNGKNNGGYSLLCKHKFPRVVVKEYMLSTTNSNECPYGTTAVDKSHCIHIIRELVPGHMILHYADTQLKDNDVQGGWGNLPPGCSLAADDKIAYWNNDQRGYNNGFYSLVCRYDNSSMILQNYTFAAPSAVECPHGTIPVDKSQCLAVVNQLIPSNVENTGIYATLVGADGCGWSHIPPGCSAQSRTSGAAHWNNNKKSVRSGGYPPVCKYTVSSDTIETESSTVLPSKISTVLPTILPTAAPSALATEAFTPNTISIMSSVVSPTSSYTRPSLGLPTIPSLRSSTTPPLTQSAIPYTSSPRASDEVKINLVDVVTIKMQLGITIFLSLYEIAVWKQIIHDSLRYNLKLENMDFTGFIDISIKQNMQDDVVNTISYIWVESSPIEVYIGGLHRSTNPSLSFQLSLLFLQDGHVAQNFLDMVNTRAEDEGVGKATINVIEMKSLGLQEPRSPSPQGNFANCLHSYDYIVRCVIFSVYLLMQFR